MEEYINQIAFAPFLPQTGVYPVALCEKYRDLSGGIWITERGVLGESLFELSEGEA